jgi:hypothetical protein
MKPIWGWGYMFLVVSGWLAYGDITEILLKVASNTLKQTNRSISIITSISLKFHQKIVSTYLNYAEICNLPFICQSICYTWNNKYAYYDIWQSAYILSLYLIMFVTDLSLISGLFSPGTVITLVINTKKMSVRVPLYKFL